MLVRVGQRMGRWERVKVVAERMGLVCDFSLPKRMNAQWSLVRVLCFCVDG